MLFTEFQMCQSKIGHHFIKQRFENGDLILAQLSRKGYREMGRQHVLEPTNEAYGRPGVWSGPAFAGTAAYLRNDKELVKIALSAK